MPVQADLEPALIDAVYRTVTEPDGWRDVCALAALAWPSSAQTFYFLDRRTRRVRPGALSGIGPGWLASFDDCYFAPDNPWIRHSEQLHRPAVVRTNERLAALLQDDGALYRSAYFNEWMRPQDFKWTIGTTMVADDRLVANFTLLRAPDQPAFDAGEVAAFERIAAHMTRALQLAMRIESAGAASPGAVVLDALRCPVALVDLGLTVTYANDAMEGLLRSRRGLRSLNGRLAATDAGAHRGLAAIVANALEPTGAGRSGQDLVGIRCGPARTLTVRAAPARGPLGRYLPSQPLALLIVADPGVGPPVRADAVRRLYGCTNAEARLVVALVDGASLRGAAAALGIRYETARTTLKSAFGKLGVTSQARLIARVLRDLPP